MKSKVKDTWWKSINQDGDRKYILYDPLQKNHKTVLKQFKEMAEKLFRLCIDKELLGKKEIVSEKGYELMKWSIFKNDGTSELGQHYHTDYKRIHDMTKK